MPTVRSVVVTIITYYNFEYGWHYHCVEWNFTGLKEIFIPIKYKYQWRGFNKCVLSCFIINKTKMVNCF